LGEGDETPEGNNAISEVCVSLFTGGDCDEANYFDLPLDRLISQLNGPRLKSIAFKSGSVNQSILKTTLNGRYNVGHPLIRDVMFCFLSEVPVTNWAAQ